MIETVLSKNGDLLAHATENLGIYSAPDRIITKTQTTLSELLSLSPIFHPSVLTRECQLSLPGGSVEEPAPASLPLTGDELEE